MFDSNATHDDLTASAPPELPLELVKRHFGLPPCAELDAVLFGRYRAARDWLASHAKPWAQTRQVRIRQIEGAQILLEGARRLTSQRLARGLESVEAHQLVVLAVSAGPEVDDRITQLWQDGFPDEAMLMNAVAIATVEHLRAWNMELLQRQARQDGLSVLPYYSPGYEGWELQDQASLYEIVCGNGAPADPPAGPLEVLRSGGLKPNKSTLAVTGLTRRTGWDHRMANYWDQFADDSSLPVAPGGEAPVTYQIPTQALEKWSRQHLQLVANADGRLRATFHFRGSTCSNMGLPLWFDFHVDLRLDDQGRYHIAHCECVPAKDHDGYQAMCAYQAAPEMLQSQLRSVQPYVGRPLDDVLRWQYDSAPAGCLCSRANQHHKWRMVLQTLHYALDHRSTQPLA